MKKALLVLFFTLFLSSISFAGGDDRDQQLPLNSLNTEQNIDEDATPRFLQEDDEVIQNEEIKQGQKEIEELIQTKLVDIESSDTTTDLPKSIDSTKNGKVQALIDRYIKSDQGILIMLLLFVVSLILIFNFFVRDK